MSRTYDHPIRHPGNQALFRALDLSILSTFVGLPLHVHAEGLRGTGKTTIMRSVRRRLPLIQRIKGCIFNCLPWAPHCPEHRGLNPAEVRAIGVEWIPMPFREISHSAKVGTVAGSIDLGRIADRTHPEAALLPGTLPQAHRGIVFVDEINRLADTAPELADILLDVMGTKPGRLQIEETGLPSVDLPISVSVWAASNPDEDPGPLEDIRKQLSDRFDFVIAMERPSATATVREILRLSRERQLAYTAVPAEGVFWSAGGGLAAGGSAAGAPPAADPEEKEEGGLAWGAAADLSATAPTAPAAVAVAAAAPTAAGGPGRPPSLEDWAALADSVRTVECPPVVEELVASLYVDFGLESLRGVEAIHHGARMNCVLEGRGAMSFLDVLAVAPGALQHRLDVSTFARVMDFLTQRSRAQNGLDAEAACRDGASLGAAADQGVGGGAGGPGGSSGQEAGAAGDKALEAARAALARAGVPGASGAEGGEGGRTGPQAGAGTGSDARSKGGGSGRLSLWSMFGRRGRGVEGGSGPASGSLGSSGLDGGTGEASSGPGGDGSSGSASSRSGQGGAGGAGQPGQAAGSGRTVAPPYAARPLSEILREMELGTADYGFGPPGPRVP